MPKLAAFAACERVVFSNDSAPPRLIRLFQQLEVPRPSGRGPAFKPIRWCLYALWTHTPEEIDKSYRQIIQLVDTQGKVYFEAPMDFSAEGRFSQSAHNLKDMPVEFEGTIACRIRLADGPVLGEYPIIIQYRPRETRWPRSQDLRSAAESWPSN